MSNYIIFYNSFFLSLILWEKKSIIFVIIFKNQLLTSKLRV